MNQTVQRLAPQMEATAGEHARWMCHRCELGVFQIIQRDLKTNGTTLKPTIIYQAKPDRFRSLTELVSRFREKKKRTCLLALTYSALFPDVLKSNPGIRLS